MTYEQAKNAALGQGIPLADITPEVLVLYGMDPAQYLSGVNPSPVVGTQEQFQAVLAAAVAEAQSNNASSATIAALLNVGSIALKLFTGL